LDRQLLKWNEDDACISQVESVTTSPREQQARHDVGRQLTGDRLTDAAHALGVFPRLALSEVRIQCGKRVPQCGSWIILPPPRAQVRHQVGGLFSKILCVTDLNKSFRTTIRFNLFVGM